MEVVMYKPISLCLSNCNCNPLITKVWGFGWSSPNLKIIGGVVYKVTAFCTFVFRCIRCIEQPEFE